MSFTCYVIGGNTLLMTCADLLRKRGHTIKGIVSPDPRVRAWAAREGLPVWRPSDAYRDTMSADPADYLFSIAYLAVIPEDVLATPRKAAINFHDGPLPHYAGLNTPAWALLRGETRYGITWHAMTAEVDRGAIYRAATFDLAPGETSLSLNTRCFETAIETFGPLIDDLDAGTAQPQPQPPGPPTYYKRHDRPAAACFLDFRASARTCADMVRALDFGPYDNPLGAPKFSFRAATVIVRAAEAREGFGAPGALMRVGEDALVVGTGEGLLAITALSDLHGRPLPLAAFIDTHAPIVGDHLDVPDDAARATRGAVNAHLAHGEAFWTRKLAEVTPLESPFREGGRPEAGDHHVLPLQLPAGLNPGDLPAAFIAFLAKTTGAEHLSLAYSTPALRREPGAGSWTAARVPLILQPTPDTTFAGLIEDVARARRRAGKHKTFLTDLIARRPALHGRTDLTDGQAYGAAVVEVAPGETVPAEPATLVLMTGGDTPRLACRKSAYDAAAAARLTDYLTRFCTHLVAALHTPVVQVSLMDAAERRHVLDGVNQTSVPFDREARIHELIEARAAAVPHAPALVHADGSVTYAEMNAEANRLARYLRGLGVGPDTLVGIHLPRGIDLVVAALAAQKAGGAYLPLDPAYPADRTAHMVADSRTPVIVSHAAGVGRLPAGGARLVVMERDRAEWADGSGDNLHAPGDAASLAYMIYTSGSTGLPKGVMVPHRTVVNFFKGMDAVIPHADGGTWLAVTSLSFDIHVLELFWTLTHGFKTVVYQDPGTAGGGVARGMQFSLFYFSNSATAEETNKYRLLLEGAKWADTHGFTAVWTPERHFYDFGGLYAHPAVTGAAVAAVTQNVQIRAGSLVVPLHHPARIAETWSMLDNLSNGRVAIAAASGWAPTDFLLMPDNFKDAKGVMFRNLEIIQKLWAGEKVAFPGATGDTVEVATLPRPVQPKLPVWITTAGNIDTYIRAGEIGASVLTHLLGQSIAELAPKIAAYRKALTDAGFAADSGTVTLMLHSFVGEDEEQVRNAVREPLKNYLGSSLNLLKKYAWAFPAFSRPGNVDADPGDDFAHLSDEERDAVLEGAFARYYETSGLFGKPESCLRMIDDLKAIGVDEVACLIDFGLPTDLVLKHLPMLDVVRRRSNPAPVEDTTGLDPVRHGLAAMLSRHAVTHMQCTPSMAQLMTTNTDMAAALRGVKHLFVGGEALPEALARKLVQTGATVTNMYGPTETTIWSSTAAVRDQPGPVSIGTPIAGNRLYVLDRRLEPLPPGAAGELFIAGDGVTRGYHGRPSLTAWRFAPDPFHTPGGRMYRTGDLVRRNGDGSLAFLGRVDFQVKIRGFRIELGEIEARLAAHAAVEEAVVLAREDQPGDPRLVAYLTTRGPAPESEDLAAFLRGTLPDYMVPSAFAVLDAFPLTPNKKIDRKALPAPEAGQTRSRVAYAAPENDTENRIATLWAELLGRDQVGIDDNFFDIGGHSLLVVRMHRRLEKLLERSIPLTDMYRFTTIRALGTYLTTGGDTGAKLKQSTDRAARRLAARRRGR